MKIRIGVFDSGSGGLSVAQAIQRSLPDLEVIFVNDKIHVPYGNRDPKELLAFVLPILNTLVNDGCEAIVIACNTVTTTIIDDLRHKIAVPLIGIEPMIKPAAKLTQSKTIAVCATPTTLKSLRYKQLKQTYASDLVIIEPDCSDWSYMIEANKLDKQNIHSRINTVCDQGADVIVLGCTHYHWIEDLINDIAKNRARVLQPEQAIITELKKILASMYV